MIPTGLPDKEKVVFVQRLRPVFLSWILCRIRSTLSREPDHFLNLLNLGMIRGECLDRHGVDPVGDLVVVP